MILLIVGQESLFTPRLSLSFGHLLASDFLLWLLSLWFWWGLGVSIQVQQISEKGEWFFINPSSKVNPHTFIHLFCSFNKRHNKSTAHGTLMSMILDVTDFFFPSIHAFKAGMAKKKKKKEAMATHSSTLAWRIPTDRGAWWAIIHGVSKSQIWLKWLSTAHALEEHYAKHMGKHKSESHLNPCSQGIASLLKKMRHTFQWFSWKKECENPGKQPKEFLTVWGDGYFQLQERK